MSRIAKGALVAAIAVGLSGCYTIEQEYEINEDQTMNLSMLIEIDLEATGGVFDDFGDDMWEDDGFDEGFSNDDEFDDFFGGDDSFGELPDDAWTWTDEEWDAYWEEVFGDMFDDFDFDEFDDASPADAPDASDQSDTAYEVSGRVDADTFGMTFDDDLTPSDEELEEIQAVLGDRFTWESYETDTVSGVRMNMVNVTMDEANQLAASGEVLDGTYALEEDGGNLTFTLRNPDGDDSDSSDLALMEGFIDYTGGITMPGEITEYSTGSIDPDNPNRLELSLSDLSASEISVTSKSGSGFPGGLLLLLLIGVGALLLLAVIIVVVVLLIKRGQNKSGAQEVPAAPAAVTAVPPAETIQPEATQPGGNPPPQ